jgi:hypothetical protein
LTVKRDQCYGSSNLTNERGVFGGGSVLAGGTGYSNVIDYITINTTGNASDFGDLLAAQRHGSATSNGTSDRGVWAGGYTGSTINVIQYITISSIGHAQDFGDLTVARYYASATSNA